MAKTYETPAELWPQCTPPDDVEQAGRDINLAICRSALSHGQGNTGRHRTARRGCGDVWKQVRLKGLAYDDHDPGAWPRVRTLGPQPPEEDGDRCLWLLAAAWRAVWWLDNRPLVQKQLIMIGSFVTDLKAGVGSLPDGFAIAAEKAVREDEAEQKKPPGPEMEPATATDTSRVVH